MAKSIQEFWPNRKHDSVHWRGFPTRNPFQTVINHDIGLLWPYQEKGLRSNRTWVDPFLVGVIDLSHVTLCRPTRTNERFAFYSGVDWNMTNYVRLSFRRLWKCQNTHFRTTLSDSVGARPAHYGPRGSGVLVLRIGTCVFLISTSAGQGVKSTVFLWRKKYIFLRWMYPKHHQMYRARTDINTYACTPTLCCKLRAVHEGQSITRSS